MQIKRINENLERDYVRSWIQKNIRSYIKDNFEITDSGVILPAFKTIDFNLKSIPDFKIISISENVIISADQNLTINDFSWLPREIEGDLIIEKASISDFKGFPEKIKGSLDIIFCKGFKSFKGIKCYVEKNITFRNLDDLKFLECDELTFGRSGVIIEDSPLENLDNLPKMAGGKSCPWFHIRKTKIKNLIGLPSCVSYLGVNGDYLEGLEGIPFLVKNEENESFTNLVNINAGFSSKTFKKINEDYQTYISILTDYPMNPGESRIDYIHRVYKQVPEILTLLAPNEIPGYDPGGGLRKKFGFY